VKFAAVQYENIFKKAIHFGLIDNRHTTIFEVVDSSFDPHVIPDKDGLWCLGKREKKWNSAYFFAFESDLVDDIHFPEVELSTVAEMTEKVKSVNHEGFVIQSASFPNRGIKLKSPFYTAVKFLGRKNKDALDKAVWLFRESGHISTPRWFCKVTNRLIRIGLREMSIEYETVKQMNEQERFTFLRSILNEVL
jgi:hypothetical protein